MCTTFVSTNNGIYGAASVPFEILLCLIVGGVCASSNYGSILRSIRNLILLRYANSHVFKLLLGPLWIQEMRNALLIRLYVIGFTGE